MNVTLRMRVWLIRNMGVPHWKLDNQEEKLVVPGDGCRATWRSRCFRKRNVLRAKPYFRMMDLVGVRGWTEGGKCFE